MDQYRCHWGSFSAPAATNFSTVEKQWPSHHIVTLFHWTLLFFVKLLLALLYCYFVTLFLCYTVTLLHCYIVKFLLWFTVILLLCYTFTMFHCYRSMHYCSDWHGVLPLRTVCFMRGSFAIRKGHKIANNIFNGDQWEYRINQKFES